MSAITASVAERWSPSRIATGLVLGAWGAMFWVLWLTDRTYLYLSTRTAWLVPMGAVIMSVAGDRPPRHSPHRARRTARVHVGPGCSG